MEDRHFIRFDRWFSSSLGRHLKKQMEFERPFETLKEMLPHDQNGFSLSVARRSAQPLGEWIEEEVKKEPQGDREGI